MSGIGLLSMFGRTVESGSGGTPFWGITSLPDPNANNWNEPFAWKFTVGASDLVVNTLKVWGNTGYSWPVRIERVSDGVVIASATLSGPTGWLTTTISPVTLEAGKAYYCASMGNGSTRYTQASSAPTYNTSVLTHNGNYYKPGTPDWRSLLYSSKMVVANFGYVS
ncbi:MAG: hypothetical protein LC118_15610 [Dehalococcoidia bacterium]|nr:hypothetical protein [Dehalococcoidia bacterium]